MALNTTTLPPNPKFIKDVSARVLNSEFTRTNKYGRLVLSVSVFLKLFVEINKQKQV
jgi:hypothetical protein